MSMLAVDKASGAARLTLSLLDGLFGKAAALYAGVRLWDGTLWPDDRPRAATVVLNHPGSLRQMFLPGTELGLAEAYLHDDYDVEGDMVSAFSLSDAVSDATSGWVKKLGIATDLARLPRICRGDGCKPVPARLEGFRHSPDRSRQAVAYHYDVSNEFYSLWLDHRMVYSCAYFGSEDEDIEAAQHRKLDYICKKLRLMPGQRLLDIGCGWGGLVMHAASSYGADATGITLSHAQAELANERIREAGLTDTCRVIVSDYREVDPPEPFDAMVSVGMFEHVGATLLPAYFEKAHGMLKPGGVFLNHGIAQRADIRPTREPGFVDVYVFPDGELVPINETVKAAETAGFELRDVESLREHYTLTLRRWLDRLEARHEEAARCTSEATYRVWRLYLAGSAHWFLTGRNSLFQALFVKPDVSGSGGMPLTRSDWYSG